jgi:hypothetical protein
VAIWLRKEFISGPLWFAEALLVFSLWYVLVRRVAGRYRVVSEARPKSQLPCLPGGYWAIYVVLFVVGVRAKPRNWIAQLTWKNGRPWVIIACVVWPTPPLGWRFAGSHANFNTGFSWAAILNAFWEPFIAWGFIAAWLLVFRERFNRPSAVWDWLNRRAYAVYIIHPPVLVGVSLSLHSWIAPALVKFSAVGLLACTATWLLADPPVQMSGARRVV